MEKNEKIASFFDWELQFKEKKKETKLKEEESEDSVSDLLNPLGVEKEKFKKFLKDWKKENL